MEIAHEELAKHGIPLTSNQVQINLLHRKIETNGVLGTARRLGVTLIAYVPLRSGMLAGKFHADPDYRRAASTLADAVSRIAHLHNIALTNGLNTTRPHQKICYVTALRAVATRLIRRQTWPMPGLLGPL